MTKARFLNTPTDDAICLLMDFAARAKAEGRWLYGSAIEYELIVPMEFAASTIVYAEAFRARNG